MSQVITETTDTQESFKQDGVLVQTVKSPATRLLDLTAGWSAYVQKEGGEYPDPGVSVDDLTQLYQDAGQVAFDAPDAGPEEEARIVRSFVEEHILPLLLRAA